MDASAKSAEAVTTQLLSVKEAEQSVVSQPQSVNYEGIMDVINLMGTVTSRIREDHSNDLPAAGAGSGRGSSPTGKSARDEAIANAPAPAIMQQKLIEHLEQEVTRTQAEARKLARKDRRGNAFALTELYRKIRRLTSLIRDIVEASTDMIKRFYISIFIDNQSLTITGESLKEIGKQA